MKALIVTFLCIVTFGCKKSSSENKKDLFGKWTLTESLMDPGDGSGQWTPATSENKITIVFEANGKFSGGNFFFGGYDRFTKTSDSTLVFESTNNSTTVPHRYKIVNSQLELNPPCFEPCGFRFKYAGK